MLLPKDEFLRIKLTVAYDGSSFFGFERQTGLLTIQGAIEDAIEKATGQRVTITPSGRTDAGVHALCQVCHFDLRSGFKLEKLQGALNFYLPSEICVHGCELKDNDFNARRSAKKKTYYYDLYISSVENPLLKNRAWCIESDLDLENIQKAMQLFVGTHDFENFRCLGSSAKTTVRTIYSFELKKVPAYGEELLRFSISADGFLYKMVRLIVGTVIKVGQGKLSLDELSSLIDKTTITKNKHPAPSHGLYLEKVEYN